MFSFFVLLTVIFLYFSLSLATLAYLIKLTYWAYFMRLPYFRCFFFFNWTSLLSLFDWTRIYLSNSAAHFSIPSFHLFIIFIYICQRVISLMTLVLLFCCLIFVNCSFIVFPSHYFELPCTGFSHFCCYCSYYYNMEHWDTNTLSSLTFEWHNEKPRDRRENEVCIS